MEPAALNFRAYCYGKGASPSSPQPGLQLPREPPLTSGKMEKVVFVTRSNDK